MEFTYPTTGGDRRFMQAMGIRGETIPDPYSRPEPKVQVPFITESDERWLRDLRVGWEREPEPGFLPPKNLREYAERYPGGIREACSVAAAQRHLDPSDEILDEWGKEIQKTFLSWISDGLEDIVAMYVTAPPRRPGQPVSDHFKGYMELRVSALLPLVV